MVLEPEDRKIRESDMVNNQLFSFDIDSVGLFSNYFPHNNVERVLKNCITKRSRKKSRHLSKKFQSRGGKIREEGTTT